MSSSYKFELNDSDNDDYPDNNNNNDYNNNDDDDDSRPTTSQGISLTQAQVDRMETNRKRALDIIKSKKETASKMYSSFLYFYLNVPFLKLC